MMALEQAFYRALAPPPNVTVSQWADQFRMLSSESSAEPGRWSTARAPYQRAIMDAMLDPLVHTVVVMSSSQIGKSEILNNILGYSIDIDPGPVLMVQPTLEMAEAYSKDRLDPMFRDTPVLRQKMGPSRTRDGSNTVRHKRFPGGHVTLAGSNSPASLASRPIRWLLADEIDRWDVSSEGDPLALAEKRTTTFWNRKHLIVSTPTVKGISRIETKFAESDQRRCYLPCPHCAVPHVLTWHNVKWEHDDPDTAHLVCPTCGSEIDEADRQEMLRSEPEWRASAAFIGTAGFHIWEGYSPWRRLSDIVADFLEAQKAPDTLQVFVNTSLGETWEEQGGDQTEAHVLLARREPYPAIVPAGACCLTLAIDTQDDRLEALIVGWGPHEESWIVESRVLTGDPQRPEPWKALDEMREAAYLHETGAQLQILSTCIDSAGHRTQQVYDYVEKHQHQKVHAIIGRDGSDRPIISAAAKKRSGKDVRKVDLFTVGADSGKSLVYSRLKITERGPGFVHLPLPHQVGQDYYAGVDEEFVAQLTAERLITRFSHGIGTRHWVKTRARNEALDLFVYAIAALRLLRPNLDVMAKRLRPVTTPAPPPTSAPSKPRWIPQRQGSWLKGGR